MDERPLVRQRARSKGLPLVVGWDGGVRSRGCCRGRAQGTAVPFLRPGAQQKRCCGFFFFFKATLQMCNKLHIFRMQFDDHWQMHMLTKSSPQWKGQTFLSVLKVLSGPLVIPPSSHPHSQATPALVGVAAYSSGSSRIYINGTIEFLSLEGGLSSFAWSNALRFVRILCGSVCAPFYCQVVFHWIHRPGFLCSPVDGHLGRVPLWSLHVLLWRLWTDTLKSSSGCAFSFLLGKYLGVEELGHMVGLRLTLGETANLFSVRPRVVLYFHGYPEFWWLFFLFI